MINKPNKIVFLYLIISIVWILASDYLVEVVGFITGIDTYIIQSIKGLFFIIVTAWLLYLAIGKQQKVLLKFGEQYKSLFHSNPNPLWIFDVNTLNFLEVNDAAIRIYGYSEEEFKSMTIRDIKPEQDLQTLKESVDNLPNKYHVLGHWRHIKKNGKIINVALTTHKIKFNNLDCAMVMAQDITLRLQQEDRLKNAYKVEKTLKEELEKNLELIKQSFESKQRLIEVVDRVNNMVVISDPLGVIMWVNPAFENFTGYGLNEVIGKSYDFLHGPKTDLGVIPKIQESLEASGFSSIEVLYYTKAGEEYWVELSISAIYNDKKEVERYIAIHNLITERKAREEKIKEQNRILRRHSWINSHAIRKPVASILGLVSLSKEMQQIEEIKEIHSLIEISSLELDAIVKEIAKELNEYENSDC